MIMDKRKLAMLLGVLLVIPAVSGYAFYQFYYKNSSVAGPDLVFVSGTEYQQGSPGQIIVKVQNAYGNPINASWCNVTIYYPDKSVFVNDTPMIQGGAPGSWYYAFTTPYTQIGVYEAYVQCSVPMPWGNQILDSSKAFHVGEALTIINRTASAGVTIIS